MGGSPTRAGRQPLARLSLALLWLAVLLAIGVGIAQHLQLSGDLRRFMPTARTPAQKLLIEELGEGPGARLLLVALSGAEAPVLARQSQALREALVGPAHERHFEVVANGDDGGLEAVPERLRPYRYLLSDSIDHHAFDRAWLADQLAQRVQDLGSPAAELVEPLLPRDPTLEALKLAQAWQPAAAPDRRHGVWFDRDGDEALLLLETRAAGFDPTGQQAALAALREAFEQVRDGSAADAGGPDGGVPDSSVPDSGMTRLTVTGPGAFSEQIAGNTRREASLFGGLGGAGFALMLLLAYRRWQVPLLAALPVASAGLLGLAAVTASSNDGVHGITLAFGFTLIGIAADYPIHLFSHLRPDQSPRDSARLIWRTLATGVASTCLAYLTFFVSGVDGLRQLAVFTVVGLATAALTTRFLLPALIAPARTDIAGHPSMARLVNAIQRLPRFGMPVVLGIAALALAVVVFVPGTFWQNDLARLTPVPEDALARDMQLRSALGAPDVRYLIAIEAADTETVLVRSERLRPALEALRAAHVIVDYDLAARYLPSMATQRARQARLPDAATLRTELAAALADSPFRADAFEGFIEDVERARAAAPLRPADLAGTPLEATLAGLLLPGGPSPDDRSADGISADASSPDESHATALVSLTGLTEPGTVARVAHDHGAQLIDLKQASESLVAEYRGRVLWALALAVVLLAAGVQLMLRDLRRTARVLAPMLLSSVLVLAVLRGLGVELNLFHLVSLMLAAGLGLDYALFFDHAGGDRDEQARTLHAVVVCAVSTLLVFALLSLSSIPVLRAIGSTVALGVLFNVVLALLVARRRLVA